MSDMRLNVTNTPMVNDTKSRNTMDVVAAEMSNSQFLDMMMTRIAGLNSDDAELKALVQKVDRNRGTDTADNKALLQRLKDVQKTDTAERADAVMKKSDIKKKIQERIKQIAESNNTAVEDKKALKAMQKTAKAMMKAVEEGEISLPKEIVQKLEEFLAKGDDFKALDIINFAQEFNDLFRGIVVAMPNGDAASTEWPAEMVDAFNEAGMGHFVSADKPADAMNILRALKALMNEGRLAAVDALDAQAKASLESAAVPAPEMMAADASVKEGVDVKAEMAVGTVAKPVTKADADSAKSLTDIMMNAAAPNRNEEKPEGDTAASDDDAPRQGREGGREGRADIAAKPQDARTAAMVNEIKAAVAAQAQGQTASSQAAIPSAANTAAVDTTLIGVDQGGVSAPAAARAAFAAEVNAAERGKPSLPTQQVMMQIQTKGANKPTQIAVQLTPVELGRVEIRLSIARDGQTHAVVVADKPETLALLQKDSTHLERALQQAGLDTNSGSMSFNLREEHQPSQFSQGRKRFSRDAIGETTAKEATMHIQPEAIISDTRINYHA